MTDIFHYHCALVIPRVVANEFLRAERARIKALLEETPELQHEPPPPLPELLKFPEELTRVSFPLAGDYCLRDVPTAPTSHRPTHTVLAGGRAVTIFCVAHIPISFELHRKDLLLAAWRRLEALPPSVEAASAMWKFRELSFESGADPAARPSEEPPRRNYYAEAVESIESQFSLSDFEAAGIDYWQVDALRNQLAKKMSLKVSIPRTDYRARYDEIMRLISVAEAKARAWVSFGGARR